MKNNLLLIDNYRNNPEFYFCKGLRYANKKNLDIAYKNIAKAVSLEPGNVEYKFNMACFLSEMRQPKQANCIFSDILLNYDPTLFDCYFGLGCNCFEMGDTKKAAEYYEKYLYFNSDGEFGEDVEEMLFYLKLYNEVSHGKKFIKLSNANLNKARKIIKENKIKDSIRYLYKSISSNPLNIDARNLLTLVLMDQRQYQRAELINRTVKNIFPNDTWSLCLSIYILSNAKKHSRVEKFLELLTYSEIRDREELLLVSTTLFNFNKIDELIRLLEMYIVEYSDSLLYCILFLAYILKDNKKKIKEVRKVLSSAIFSNIELPSWIKHIEFSGITVESEFRAFDEYEELFFINNEPVNYMYHPMIYRGLVEKKQIKKTKLTKRYSSIIDCTYDHREIMYTSYYKKEIIELLSECINRRKTPIKKIDSEVQAYSAALEYIYCEDRCIKIGKEELVEKYKISSSMFDNALKTLSLKE